MHGRRAVSEPQENIRRPGKCTGARDERAPPLRSAERRPTVWRAEDAGAGPRKGPKTPRRGADPKAERAALAERPRERIGAITAREGRKVVVERLVSEPKPEREQSHFDAEANRRG